MTALPLAARPGHRGHPRREHGGGLRTAPWSRPGLRVSRVGCYELLADHPDQRGCQPRQNPDSGPPEVRRGPGRPGRTGGRRAAGRSRWHGRRGRTGCLVRAGHGRTSGPARRCGTEPGGPGGRRRLFPLLTLTGLRRARTGTAFLPGGLCLSASSPGNSAGYRGGGRDTAWCQRDARRVAGGGVACGGVHPRTSGSGIGCRAGMPRPPAASVPPVGLLTVVCRPAVGWSARSRKCAAAGCPGGGLFS